MLHWLQQQQPVTMYRENLCVSRAVPRNHRRNFTLDPPTELTELLDFELHHSVDLSQCKQNQGRTGRKEFRVCGAEGVHGIQSYCNDYTHLCPDSRRHHNLTGVCSVSLAPWARENLGASGTGKTEGSIWSATVGRRETPPRNGEIYWNSGARRRSFFMADGRPGRMGEGMKAGHKMMMMMSKNRASRVKVAFQMS